MGTPVGQRAEGGRPGVLPQEGVGQGALQQPEPGLCPDAQNQEMQRESAAGRRPQWRKKPEPPLGPEVSGGPGAGAAVPGESGQPVPSPPCRPGLCPAWGYWGNGGIPALPQEPPCPNRPLSHRCEEPVPGQQPCWSPLPLAFHTGYGRTLASILPTPLGQACPVAWLASFPHPCWGRHAPCLVQMRALHICTEPHHPVHADSCSSSSSSIRWHQCLCVPLPGWPPPSLCHLPGWRSRADPSQALPCSPSHPTCCPGQAILCPLPTLKKEQINSFTLRCDQ